MLHIVYDTKGAGRIVGVFADRERALRICEVDPPYFRLMSVELDTVNAAAIEWLSTAEKREQLATA